MLIQSKENSIVKYGKKLQNKKHSLQYNECFLESSKIIFEMLSSNFEISAILLEKDIYDKNTEKLKDFKGKIYFISKSISNYLTESTTSSGVFAFVKLPDKKTDIDTTRFIVLDNVQDPSNVGAILRSAYAFNYKTIFFINSAYPYCYKVIRGSMGYVFSSNIIFTTIEELEKLKKQSNFQLFCADMEGEDISNVPKDIKNLGIVIGNEGSGVSKELHKLCDKTIKIPMQNNVESLNASVSAGIFMFVLNQK